MADSALRFAVTVNADGVATGLKIATKSVDDAAALMKQGLAQIGSAANEATEKSAGFTDAIKDFKSEAVGGQRTAKFFANSLAEVIPGADGAAASMRSLIAVGLSGSLLGAGFEIAVLALGSIAEHVQHASKVAAEMRAAYRETANSVKDSLEQVQHAIEGPLTQTGEAWRSESKKVQDSLRDTAAAAYELRANGGAWLAIKDFFTVVANGSNSAAPVNLPSEKEAVELFQRTQAKVEALGAAKKQRDEAQAAEDAKRAARVSVEIQQIEASTRDEILKISTDLAAKLHDLDIRKQELGSDYQRLRVAEEEKAARQIALIREQREIEAQARMNAIEGEFSERQQRERMALETKLLQIGMEKDKAGTAERRAELQKQADDEEAASARRIARMQEEDAASLARQRRSINAEGAPEEIRIATDLANKIAEIRESIDKTRTAEQATAEIRLEQELASKKIGIIKLNLADEAEAVESADNLKEARKLQHIRKQADEEIASILRMENLGVITHEAAERRKTEINRQAEQQRMLIAGEFASGGINALVTSWSRGFEQMLRGTYQWSSLVKNIFASLIDAMIQGVVQWAAKWVTEQLLALAGSIAASKAVAIAEVQANAAIAGSGAAAAVAATPVVGPAMAISAMSAVSAAVLAAMLPTAAGGYDIPAGVNPVTQLHAREMVLPASIAQPLRQSLAEGGLSGGSGGPVHLHVHAMDGASVERVIRRNPGPIVKVLREAMKNGRV